MRRSSSAACLRSSSWRRAFSIAAVACAVTASAQSTSSAPNAPSLSITQTPITSPPACNGSPSQVPSSRATVRPSQSTSRTAESSASSSSASTIAGGRVRDEPAQRLEQHAQHLLQVERARERVAHVAQRLGALAVTALDLLDPLALRDLREVDRDAGARPVDAVLEPAVPRLVVLLEEDRRLLVHRLLVRGVERLLDAFGELLPDVLADEVGRLAAEQLARALVDVRVAPVAVECDEAVGDALEDGSHLLGESPLLLVEPPPLGDVLDRARARAAAARSRRGSR